MTHDELLDRARAVLLRHDDVLYAYLFGSRASGGFRPESDVDVAIGLRESDHSHRVWLDVMGELAQAVAPLALDCLLLKGAPVGLRFAVVRDGRTLLDRDPAARRAFEVATRRKYWDWEPHRRTHEEALLRRLREGTYGTRDARPLAQG